MTDLPGHRVYVKLGPWAIERLWCNFRARWFWKVWPAWSTDTGKRRLCIQLPGSTRSYSVGRFHA